METYKILLIEDDPIYIKVLSHTLENIGKEIKILQTNNGFEALEILEKEMPDLIVTDWDMPQMSGIEFCKKIQTLQDYKDIPVIMCTGINTSSENLKTAFESGVVDFLRKPIDKMELIARVSSMLKLSESYQTIKKQKEEIENEKRKSDSLLLNILVPALTPSGLHLSESAAIL